MNPKLKKIIAREGLIILGVMGIALLVYCIGIIYSYFHKPLHFTPVPVVQRGKMDFSEFLTTEELFGHRFLINEIAFWILFYSYPAYLVIRFIIWAIKTLRDKKK